ncbi:MAG: roadblock/LC7 domain-containing protein [candidate division KSB1 bacterium]|nr:roadblock/LC7 domain-containing protein [candidate division KSB1 bacterium]MDZ7275801.1 roadblock/LC7 domain-containing protein [candidate division KSB1 bacterium]MDZ7287553.1 roadblock/LC7 domain-containing protein [candidate division KSB1 bacterium]MDZ7308043.1 roadblock/LC7 domain-containing protein [candidate division KSB1 bacterium]MDZ7350531.1 roadblock/LC7 domain-containing protein [candidate division KSB1 bacterium]
MVENTKAELTLILKDLRNNNAGIEGAALIAPDGRLIADDFPADAPREKVATVCGALLELGAKTTTALEHGAFRELHLKGAAHATVLYNLKTAVLALRLAAETNLGMINLSAQEATEAIRLLLAGEQTAS